MPLSTIFAQLSVATGQELDNVLAELGFLVTIGCTASGSNALALTPESQAPSIPAYPQLQGFSFTAVADNTGPVTAHVGGLATLNVYKNSAAGPVALASGDIVTGNFIILYYDARLNSNNGGFHFCVGNLSSSGLPAGGSVGQPLVNTGSGTGDWGNTITAPDNFNLTLNGGKDAAIQLHGGDLTTTGGQAGLFGGNSTVSGVKAGEALVSGGTGLVGNTDGGNITLALGAGVGTGRDGSLEITGATSLPGVATGTLTNAPKAGNPDKWIEVVIDGVTGWMPWWHA